MKSILVSVVLPLTNSLIHQLTTWVNQLEAKLNEKEEADLEWDYIMYEAWKENKK